MRILVPTDYSASANNAVKYAVQLAKKTNSELLFFNSVYSLINDDKLDASYTKEYLTLKLRAENKIREEINKVYKSVGINPKPDKINFIVKFDTSPVKDLINLAKEHKVDLIIMGTHGASGVKKILFGSNTSHVISNSTVPVLAIPLRHAYHPIKEIVYATDLANVQKELNTLGVLGKQLKTKITCLYFDYGWAKDKNEIKNLALINTSKIKFHTHKITLETPLLKPISKYMQGKSNSILCMFHKQKSGISNILLGSNTEGLSMDLKNPLLSIQKG
jgi:nucleotide-binding universal stress UspA family protein